MIKRYQREVMHQLWSDQNKFDSFLKVEIASLQAWSKLKEIPQSDVEFIAKHATFKLAEIEALEETLRHDVIAFTRAVSLSLGQYAKWFHYGLTSTDVVDSAQGVILKDVNDILLKNLEVFSQTLKEQAIKYKDVPCIGRTHGVHADITSFGLKWALWYDEFNRQVARFKQARTEIEVAKISGAVGNFANVPPFIQDDVCQTLGLKSVNISTQVLQRDRHASYLFTLASIAATIEKIALEIRHLSRTEVREVEEFFNKGQKGSSAMPHKRNPIASENMAGCARLMRGYAQSALEDMALWHERDISHSSVERVILPDATSILDYMLTRYQKVLQNLTVFPKQMEKNIYLTNKVIFSQRVLNALIQTGLTRDNAYDIVQKLAHQAWQDNLDFEDLLKQDAFISKTLGNQQITACFTLDYYLKEVDTIYKRIGII